jgi:L-seryl-tRNA(Ser) seleniumtransferase
MISASPEALALRAGNWKSQLEQSGISCEVVAAHSTVGGGSLPGEVLPTQALAVSCARPDALAAALRQGDPPVVGRIVANRLLLDPRTVLPELDGPLLAALVAAWRETTGENERPVA